MRTIETIAYTFNELSDNAKETAIVNYRYNADYSWIYEDALSSIKAFNNIFNTKMARDYFDVNTSNIDENILNLSGLRLRKYLINNFSNSLYKGKYFSIQSKTEKSYKYYTEGFPVTKKRYSKVMKVNDCAMTGMCYDDVLLTPIYKFIEEYASDIRNNNYVTFEDLLGDCFHSLKISVEDEIEGNNTEEAIAEYFYANGYEFDENGNQL